MLCVLEWTERCLSFTLLCDMKKLLLLVAFCAFLGLPAQTFAASFQVHLAASVPVMTESLLEGTITSIKGATIKVQRADRTVVSVIFTAKVSMVDEMGKSLTPKQLRVGDRFKATGTFKGKIFQISRFRRVGRVTPVVGVSSSYTALEVASHREAANCWVIIDRSVYNLTTWVSRHPGGQEAIISLCGKDGSSAFHAMHGNDTRPAQMLATFKIGIVKP